MLAIEEKEKELRCFPKGKIPLKKKEKERCVMEKRRYHIIFTPDNDIKYLKIYQMGANIC